MLQLQFESFADALEGRSLSVQETSKQAAVRGKLFGLPIFLTMLTPLNSIHSSFRKSAILSV